jgi:hypothetical protein
MNEEVENLQKEFLKEAQKHLRDVYAKMLMRVPPADLAGVLLVQALAIMNLERDADACAQWLRDLADGIDALGVDEVVSKQDLN